ncbi:MAG: hypothetical protein F6J97_16035, partial [Leptolyngbya sp. SIO4C1]|nr:hypothetical protein [Leptolyngbya sp. SIO4C1]
ENAIMVVMGIALLFSAATTETARLGEQKELVLEPQRQELLLPAAEQ